MEVPKIFNSRKSKAVSQVVLPIASNFRGDLRVKGDCHIGGEFEGNIFSDGSVFIDHNANFRGFILADTITIAGNAQGQFDCQHLDVLKKGEVHGDIKSAILNIEPGGNFFGHSHKDRERTFQSTISSEVIDMLGNLGSLLVEEKKSKQS